MFRAAFFLALALSVPALAQDVQWERREPTTQESESLQAFQGSAPRAAVFDIVRASRKQPWRVEASIDGVPYRGAAALCRMTRTRYAYDARAAAGRRWSATGEKRFAWIDRATCARPARPVELKQRIPDAELTPLIANQGELLLRARLLFSGNTSCAPHRSLRFQLAALDVSAPPHGKEELHALVFASDRSASAQVWIRKRGAELNAWDVACTDPALTAQ